MWIREKGREMKRTGFLLATAMAFVMCLAVPALAADGSSLPHNPGGPGVSGAGGTAFTGANVQTSFLYLVAFHRDRPFGACFPMLGLARVVNPS